MARRKSRRVNVALVKVLADWGRPERNLELLENVTQGLESAKLDVMVTPECFLDGYMVRQKKKCTKARLRACSVSGPDDPHVRRAARVAGRLACYLVFGATERGPGGSLHNVAYVIDRAGGHVGTYRKIHVNRPYEPGNALPVFATDFGTVGILICADRRWPENARVLRLKGAELILNPTWGWHGEGNTAIVRTRAYENGIPVCFAHPCQSLICMPDGAVGAVLESNCPGVLVHRLDLKHNVPAKETPDKADSHPAQNRRPDLYGPLCSL